MTTSTDERKMTTPKPVTAISDVEGYLEPQQIQRILNACAGEKEDRDRLLFLILFRTGRRLSEVLAIKPRNINQDKGTIVFKILKKRNNKNLRKIKAVDDKVLAELNKYIEKYNIEFDEYIFQSPVKEGRHITRQNAFKVFRKTCEKAGISDVGTKKPHPHHLRHSFAVNFLRKSKSQTSLKMLQQWLEHTNINTTADYLQFNQEESRIMINKIFEEEEEEDENI